MKQEEKYFSKWEGLWEEKTNKYMESANSRRDTRTESTPEIFGDY